MAWIDDHWVADVSHWQEPQSLDWRAAAAAGCVGAIVKYSQAAVADPAAVDHASDAYSAGVPLLGGYHFGDGSDVAAQVDFFLDRMRADYSDDLTARLVMLDAETNKPQMSVELAESFCTLVHAALGRWPWLYMGRFGPDGTGAGLPSAILSNCNLLVPAYGDHAGNLAAILPPGWRVPLDGADRRNGAGLGLVRGWQFTDGTVNGGAVAGLGRVDQSRLIGVASLAEAAAIWAS